MAKSPKQRAAALNTSTASIGDNSEAAIIVDTFEHAIETIKGYGDEYRTSHGKALRAQLNAGIAFGKAVEAGSMTIEQNREAAIAYNPDCVNNSDTLKSLMSDLKTFALEPVRKSANYDGLTKLEGKSLFQTALKLNRAIRDDFAAQKPVKGKDGKALPKVVPTVDAAFIEAAMADKPTKPVSETTKHNRAIKKLTEALALFGNAKMVALAKEELKARQIAAIKKLFEALTTEAA
jgi:hypothetical protein